MCDLLPSLETTHKTRTGNAAENNMIARLPWALILRKDNFIFFKTGRANNPDRNPTTEMRR